MSSSLFFLQAKKDAKNERLIEEIEQWSIATNTQSYVIDRPLGDSKYRYSHKDHLVILAPNRKIVFVNFSTQSIDEFENFVEDFVEDLGSISDKYRYKEAIGRPRAWKTYLIAVFPDAASLDWVSIQAQSQVDDPGKQRIVELLISLLTGSINDIDRVRADPPENLLDKVKRKILLFDADQTRFVYQDLHKHVIRIQGLSGTGKTELLLHKLKDLYVRFPESRIAFTCHNRILADSLRRRIPDFFDFMKVEQQIAWNERLWCMHAWGSQNDLNSGTYRYLCSYYGVPFERYSRNSTFAQFCSSALDKIKSSEERPKAFDYILIDESQDFDEPFIKLCEHVSEKTVYVAGDIFQSIFDENINSSISPDYLLSKCYRTDPKTLMFAHSVGMGLFEKKKLRWLEDEEWKKCGYIVSKSQNGDFYRLMREPLRRFEDIQDENLNCVTILPTYGPFLSSATAKVVDILRNISKDNPTITPDDVGIIFVDSSNDIYLMADVLEQTIPRETGWEVNKAHETKQRLRGRLFVSNRNNVKGLEFPFVICVTKKIGQSYAYRNSLYMTLTRSFLKSYLVLSAEDNSSVLPDIMEGLRVINERGCIEVQSPTESEKKHIRTTIKHSGQADSFYDFVQKIFDEANVLPLFRQRLMEVLTSTIGEDFDRDNVREVIDFNYARMLGSQRDEDL